MDKCTELKAALSSKLFCDAVLGMRVLGLIFSWPSFILIDAVGSKILTALREYIDCDTHQRAPSNSSIKLLNVRVLGFAVGRLLNDHIPRHRCHFSWPLLLALKLGEHFMSKSMVTPAKVFFRKLVRQAALGDRADLLHGVLSIPRSKIPEFRS